MIHVVISAGRATLAELDTVLSTEDLFDLYEMVQVEQHNNAAMRDWQRRQG